MRKRTKTLFLALAALLFAAVASFGAEIRRPWLPEGMIVHQEGDTLAAEREDSTGLAVRIYPVHVKADSRRGFLRGKAVQAGVPPYVRIVSEDQRKLAGIEWGGFVLGTVNRALREDSLKYGSPAYSANYKGDTPERTTQVEFQDSLSLSERDEFHQPEGRLARQIAIILYIKHGKGFIMEISLCVPEGDPMELTDIQRRWKP